MRFLFKTSYNQDIRLFKDAQTAVWYGLLVIILFALPAFLGGYYLSLASFIGIYSIIGLGLMLLSGYTGQISLGHAAFMAIGAYLEVKLFNAGVPFLLSISLSVLGTALIGAIVGLPALRLHGIYLAIATLAFGLIVEAVLYQWDSVTGGSLGLTVGNIHLLGMEVTPGPRFYYLVLLVAIGTLLIVRNLLRSPTGRALVAIRDSEVSARSMGVNLAKYKTLSFTLSAGITGLGGALYAHQLQLVNPTQFSIFASIELLMIIIIGGMGSLHGAVLGAVFMTVLPELIVTFQGYLPMSLAYQPGLQPMLFGLLLVAFVIFEPKGLYGRWVKVRTYFQLFPFYKKGMFAREKTYMKSERLN